MANIFHKWWNPHCSECREEREEANRNVAIEILQAELDRLTRANQSLLTMLSNSGKEIEKPVEVPKNYEPIRKSIPWRVRQQMLEEEDRNKARVLREQQITQDDLDKELESLKQNA